MNREEFIKELEKINILLSNKQLNQLELFYKLLVEWNQKINLTRIIENEEVYLKHFYDSLTLNRVVDLKNTNTLCDIGTGAGFPGVVLKIAFPNLKVTLVDSLQKRVNYLNEVIKELQLDNIEAFHSRGEDFNGSFDVVTSRAVANIEKLVNYTMHLVSKDGVFVAMKGDIDNELTPDIEKKINKKYKIINIDRFLLPKEESKRSLVVMKKI